MSWETTIGLEIHVQLSTKTKLFSGASTQFGSNPNTQVDSENMMSSKKVLPRKSIGQKRTPVEKMPTTKNTWSTSTTIRKS